MARDVLINVSQDERERARNRSRRMWQTDYESDMYTSKEQGRQEERDIWQGVIASKDAEIADKDAEIAALRARLAELY